MYIGHSWDVSMLYKVVTLYYSTSAPSESGTFETKWRLIRVRAQS